MSVNELTVLEEKESWDASDAVVVWNIIAIVYIALAYNSLALVLI